MAIIDNPYILIIKSAFNQVGGLWAYDTFRNWMYNSNGWLNNSFYPDRTEFNIYSGFNQFDTTICIRPFKGTKLPPYNYILSLTWNFNEELVITSWMYKARAHRGSKKRKNFLKSTNNKRNMRILENEFNLEYTLQWRFQGFAIPVPIDGVIYYINSFKWVENSDCRNVLERQVKYHFDSNTGILDKCNIVCDTNNEDEKPWDYPSINHDDLLLAIETLNEAFTFDQNDILDAVNQYIEEWKTVFPDVPGL